MQVSHVPFLWTLGGWHRRASGKRSSTSGWESKMRTRKSEYPWKHERYDHTYRLCIKVLSLTPIVVLAAPVNTRWWTTTRTCPTTTSVPGSSGTWTASKRKLCYVARETEHSWSETAANQAATPAVLCTLILPSSLDSHRLFLFDDTRLWIDVWVEHL